MKLICWFLLAGYKESAFLQGLTLQMLTLVLQMKTAQHENIKTIKK